MEATRECRLCGSIWPFPSHFWITEGGGCRTCGGSPLCDLCGHPRAKHIAVYLKGRRLCKFRAFDMQSLTHIACDCEGWEPVDGTFADATFAQPETEPLSPLRFVGETSPPAPDSI